MYSNNLIVDILNYIDDNLYSKITIDEISKKFFFNKDYIMRLFKRETDMTIINYINKRRIYNCLSCVRESNQSFIMIALNYGYNSLEYFSETFSNIIGVSPTIYKKFYKRKRISLKDIEIIRNNITDLSCVLHKIDVYKVNIKKIDSKVLSLFK